MCCKVNGGSQRHDYVSGDEAALELRLACARRRGSQGELVVQRNWCRVKWRRLATTQAVMVHNGKVVGKAAKIVARSGRNQGGVESAKEGA